MITVKVEYFGSIRSVVGKSVEEVRVPDGTTIKELVLSLAERYGRNFRDQLLTEGINLKDDVRIVLDGEVVPSLDVETKLSGEKGVRILSMLPPLVGGKQEILQTA